MKTTKLILRFLLFVTLFSTSVSICAAERVLMNFEFLAGGKIINQGNAIVSIKKKTWKKGLQRNFLKLSCRPNESGNIKKAYSTIELFTGLKITHQLIEKNIELTVVRTVGQPRVAEIRALPEGKCEDLSPLFTTTTQTYTLPVKNGLNESRPFDESTTFRARLRLIGGIL